MQADSVHAEACDDVHTSIRRAPDQGAEGVLFRSVEGSRNEHECRRDSAFKTALERAQNHQASPVLRKRNAQHDNAPAEYDDAQELADVELLHQVVSRELADHVREVEDCAEPAELLPYEPGVFSEAEDRHGADGRLVGLLGAVAQPHEREEPKVDLPT